MKLPETAALLSAIGTLLIAGCGTQAPPATARATEANIITPANTADKALGTPDNSLDSVPAPESTHAPEDGRTTTADLASTSTAPDSPPVKDASGAPAETQELAQPAAERTAISDASQSGTAENGRAAVAVEKPKKPLVKDSAGIYAVNFEDLKINMPADTIFKRSMLTDRVKTIEGEKIRIRGFIHAGTVLKQKGIRDFLLLKNTECKYGPQGEAHHIIVVKVDKKTPGISYTVRPLTLEGKFRLRTMDGPDGNTWTIYFMDCDKVTK